MCNDGRAGPTALRHSSALPAKASLSWVAVPQRRYQSRLSGYPHQRREYMLQDMIPMLASKATPPPRAISLADNLCFALIVARTLLASLPPEKELARCRGDSFPSWMATIARALWSLSPTGWPLAVGACSPPSTGTRIMSSPPAHASIQVVRASAQSNHSWSCVNSGLYPLALAQTLGMEVLQSACPKSKAYGRQC